MRDQWQPSQSTINKYKELGYTPEEAYALALEEEISFKDLEDLEDDRQLDTENYD